MYWQSAAICGSRNLPRRAIFCIALSLTAYAMAISSTLCGAVLVENGQRLHESGAFVNQQWLWFNIAAMAAAILGGELVQHLAPAQALHTAALIVGVAPSLVIFGTLFLIDEKRMPINVDGMKATLHGLIAAFRRRELLVVAAFIFLYYFSPGLATPLYYHMTDELKFSQAYIGILTSIAAGGWVVGALLYRRFLEDLSMKKLLYLSIVCGTLTTLAYLLLVQRSVRGDHQFLRRLLGHAGDGGDRDTGRRLLSAARRRIFLRGADVGDQSVEYGRRQCRFISLRQRLCNAHCRRLL